MKTTLNDLIAYQLSEIVKLEKKHSDATSKIKELNKKVADYKKYVPSWAR